MFKRLCAVLLLMAVIVFTAAFQTISPEPGTENPNANISFPPPVYVVRGEVEVRGTVNLPNVVGYFFEVRPLEVSAETETETDDGEGWLPVTIPSNAVIINDVLGVWDTTLFADGLYELRLSVRSTTEEITSVVSPLRIENELPPFLTPEAPAVEPTTAAPVVDPPTAVPASTSPTGTARVNGNVRTGDTTNYPVIAALQPGQTVPVVGLSNTGSGWWVVRLADGRQGFVAPSVIDVTGDTGALPLIAPPPPPVVQPTAVPTATAVPVSTQPDAALSNIRFDRSLRQGEAFQIFVTVSNFGGAALNGAVIACNFTPQNQLFAATAGTVNPGTQIDVAITARLDSGGGQNTTANCAADVNNLIAESNEGNNFASVTVALANP
ncbi:MAG: CARDB domain-containing protein [bacterium]|nr:CARDB domain-containing protein [bacterium]